MSEPRIILPPGWPRPSGYSNAVVAHGTVIALAGQVGWDPVSRRFASEDLVDQLGTALENVVSVLAAAGAGPGHVVRMTWFITDRDAYVNRVKEIGETYRRVFGRVYPAMSVVAVSALIEPQARIEIEATAVLP